jgi:murein DD-endopeptidase MepM/ murein hydrolase activator NlpD
MNRYYTIMLVPEREKGVKSFRIPRLMFHSATFVSLCLLLLVAILGYDYWRILQQISENKHLNIENRQLKEQIQLNQMKINALADEIQRIHTFEKKLRIITGIESLQEKMRPIPTDLDTPGDIQGQGGVDTTMDESDVGEDLYPNASEKEFALNLGFDKMKENPEFKRYKRLYDEKIAANFGLSSSYAFTKNWSDLIKRSFALSEAYATFDFKFKSLKKISKDLEVRIHELDQFLLDKESFIKSTPTLLPTRGWITSYYGPRKSPYSGRIKMHEGLDIGAKPGTGVVAPADGIITYAGYRPGFGKLVQIDHGYGIETYFGHNRSINVRSGQRVKRGDVISKVGSTGRSTGPHVHYEVRVNGIAVDPLYYILE